MLVQTKAALTSRCALEASILDRLCNVRWRDFLRSFEIGNGPRGLEHAVIAARREPETRGRLLQDLRAARIGRTKPVQLAARKQHVGFSLALKLARTGSGNPVASGRGAFAVPLVRKLLLGHRRHLDLEVDAVEKRSRNPGAIARDLVGRAAAAAIGVPEISAWAWTRCLFAMRACCP